MLPMATPGKVTCPAVNKLATLCASNGQRLGICAGQRPRLDCVPDQRQDAGIDAKQAAYEDYDREMAQAYLRK